METESYTNLYLEVHVSTIVLLLLFLSLLPFDYFFYLVILIFSISINQYYGFFAVNPLDNFTIYHSGNLILNGQKPFQDYWVTTGLTLDTIQYLFFKFFGTSVRDVARLVKVSNQEWP